MNLKSLVLLFLLTSLFGLKAKAQPNNDFKKIAKQNIREIHSEKGKMISKFSRNGYLNKIIINYLPRRSKYFFDSLGYLIAYSSYKLIDNHFILNDTVSIRYQNNEVISIKWHEDFNKAVGAFKFVTEQKFYKNNNSVISSYREVQQKDGLKDDIIYSSDELVKLDSHQYQLTNLEISNIDTLTVRIYKYNIDATGRIVQIFKLNYYDNNAIEQDCTECIKVKKNTYECTCERIDDKQISGRFISLYMPEALELDGFLPKCRLSKKGIYYQEEPLRAYKLSRKQLGKDSVQLVYY